MPVTNALPHDSQEFMRWPWQQIEPFYQELARRPLDAHTVDAWLRDWTRLAELVSEGHERLYVAMTLDTVDAQIRERYHAYLDEVLVPSEEHEQLLRRKLLDSGLEPAGLAVPMRNMRAEAELFRVENLALLNDERKIGAEYDALIAAQTVEWQGQELTLPQLRPICQENDRNLRERAWRMAHSRQLADREAINALWGRLLALRLRIAANAGCANYRDYRWGLMWRHDYTPEDCARFRQAIAEVVVPAATRLYARRRARLGLETLRPWDLDVDPQALPPLRPFADVQTLEARSAAIFDRVDPQLGNYFTQMRSDGLLDLENRKGKAPGGYCTAFSVERRPFIFMNAVGIHDDVQTMLHEAGHAFHVFESASLPYAQQLQIGMEFAEVASMAMELLAAPYLPIEQGGFYSQSDAARARVEHLEGIILFWPYMAVVDAFQHWAYATPEAAAEPARCDAAWAELWGRFMPGVDWSGLDAEMMTGWHRKQHIHRIPFYYIEYGLAQLGAVQVWRNARSDQAGAIARYRDALALGGTVTLPELFAAAGARLAFDAETLGAAVELVERTIDELGAP
jgi:oligoendopeptidase F